mmetsp:Transcript_6346/g.16255  ORF Transcript_6346/g.16255 Transcript_6346/m.16255 type:complete len:276 (+) Transcript_6346:303-1130(+)
MANLKSKSNIMLSVSSSSSISDIGGRPRTVSAASPPPSSPKVAVMSPSAPHTLMTASCPPSSLPFPSTPRLASALSFRFSSRISCSCSRFLLPTSFSRKSLRVRACMVSTTSWILSCLAALTSTGTICGSLQKRQVSTTCSYGTLFQNLPLSAAPGAPVKRAISRDQRRPLPIFFSLSSFTSTWSSARISFSSARSTLPYTMFPFSSRKPMGCGRARRKERRAITGKRPVPASKLRNVLEISSTWAPEGPVDHMASGKCATSSVMKAKLLRIMPM